MPEIQAHRTLVKSPPELWAELSDAESLSQHLGDFGEIRITRTQPESTVAWEGEHIRGTVSIEPSGWGTQVSLTARIALPEPEPQPPPAPPERVEHTVRVIGADVVRIDPPPPPEPEPEPEPDLEPEPDAAPPRRRGFLSRLLGRAFPLDAAAEPVPVPEPDPVPEPPAAPAPVPEPYELRVVHAVVACRVPVRPMPPPPPEPPLHPERAASVLADVLERLGAAHHRPFSRS